MSTTEPSDSLQGRIAARLVHMTRAEQKVAEYFRNHSREVVFSSAEQIGAAVGTSDATVVRTAKTLGYSGLIELKYALGQQVMDATRFTTRLQDRIEQAGKENALLLEQVFTEAVERLTETWRIVPPADFDKAVDLLADAPAVLAFGVGPSEFAARYMELRLHRLGRRARATGATGFRLADDLLTLGSGDVVVIFAPGRLLRDTDALVDHATKVGAHTLLITDSLAPLLADRVDVVLPSVHSPSGFSGETLGSQVLTDALILGLSAKDIDRTTETLDLLTALRAEITNNDSADYFRRRQKGS
jgi:DNA-binding MurR/RpiR family transcriptional regulator